MAIKFVSASQRGSVSEVSSLIEQGANVNKVSQSYKCYNSTEQLGSFFPQYGEIVLFAACEGSKHEVVKILLQAGVDPNVQNTVSTTLHYFYHFLI